MEYYKFFNICFYIYKGWCYGNYNKLFGWVKGVDGIKIGYICVLGFNLVILVNIGGWYIVVVVMGGWIGVCWNVYMMNFICWYLLKVLCGVCIVLLLVFGL